jgi:hypothetical protein
MTHWFSRRMSRERTLRDLARSELAGDTRVATGRWKQTDRLQRCAQEVSLSKQISTRGSTYAGGSGWQCALDWAVGSCEPADQDSGSIKSDWQNHAHAATGAELMAFLYSTLSRPRTFLSRTLQSYSASLESFLGGTR